MSNVRAIWWPVREPWVVRRLGGGVGRGVGVGATVGVGAGVGLVVGRGVGVGSTVGVAGVGLVVGRGVPVGWGAADGRPLTVGASVGAVAELDGPMDDVGDTLVEAAGTDAAGLSADGDAEPAAAGVAGGEAAKQALSVMASTTTSAATPRALLDGRRARGAASWVMANPYRTRPTRRHAGGGSVVADTNPVGGPQTAAGWCV
jgi:hypothetical protein